MTAEQILGWLTGLGATLLTGGGVWAGVNAFSNRKIGLKTTENEANKTINTTWEAIVDDLQSQIASLGEKLGRLEERVERAAEEGHRKDRLLISAIGYINRLELLIPPEKVPPRPEGLN